MRRPKDRLDKLLKGYYRSSGRSVEPGGMEIHDMAEPCKNKMENVCYSMKMPCDKLPKKVCPSSESLSAYTDNLLSENDRETIAMHIQQCKKCSDTVKSAQDAVKHYLNGDLENAPRDISDSTRSRLYSSDRKTKPPEDKKSL